MIIKNMLYGYKNDVTTFCEKKFKKQKVRSNLKQIIYLWIIDLFIMKHTLI